MTTKGRFTVRKSIASENSLAGTFPEKRAMDMVVSVLALLVLSPGIVLVAALALVCQSTPILFRQQRPGLCSEPFTLYKFRTMADDYDGQGRLLADARRLTTLGRFLRATSLDELPELLNVLRGEMSLVGPRPLLMAYLDRYTPDQARRHEVKPGITGWAQVSGRNALSWEEKFALDVWYVDHQSLGLDMKIIALTVWKIIKREGISQPGHVSMPEFLGSARQ